LHGSSRIVLGRFQQHVGLIGGAAAVFEETESATPPDVQGFVPESLEWTSPAKPALLMSNSERRVFERVEGTIFDVQRYSLDDGPGLRTSVFLKGCPLRCAWCANPESQHMRPELLFFESSCLTCGTCVGACKAGSRSIADNHVQWDRQACTKCGDCVQICPAQATVWSGRRIAAGEVVQQVLRDLVFYEDGGGLTLTGGEPLLQPAFAEALLRLAKVEQIHTAIETTGNAPWKTIELLQPYIDLWLFDLKHMDSQLHRHWTGLGNELILSNLRKLAQLGAPIRVRLPLIPGVNMDSDNLRQTADFVAKLGGAVQSLDLLPYHKLARAKYEALGRGDKWFDADLVSEEQIRSAAAVLRPYNLTVRIAGEYSTKENLCLQ